MTYKHFTDPEIAGLNPDVANGLDTARDVVGFPIRLTCTVRSPEDNARVGGVSDSAHLLGLAADMQRPVGNDEAIMLAFALGVAGFKRLEVADKHFHVDIDPTKPSPCIWKGISH